MTYKCIRCQQDSDIVGFCEKCYPQIYGVEGQEIVYIKMDELKLLKGYLELEKRNDEYSTKLVESIKNEGLRNPIIVNDDYYIVIGYHRYFLYKSLGFSEIPAYIVEKDRPYNKFTEGEGNNLFILKIDGKLKASVTHMDDIVPIMLGWILKTPSNRTSFMNVECYTNIGVGSTTKCED
jgi:hypothetical protein